MANTRILLLLAGLVAAFAGPTAKLGATDDEWAAFKVKYERSYDSAEEHDYRASVFADNLDFVREYNAKHTSHWVAVNNFADLTHDEFRAGYVSGSFPKKGLKAAAKDADWKYANVKAKDRVDWREQNAVTDVKNQGQCGACWAFSTTGAVEGANAIAGNGLTPLSEQELVDCAGGSAGNQGCNGGLMDDAFRWVEQNGGLTTEESYPYTAADGKCDTSKTGSKDAKGFVNSFQDVPASNEDALMKAVSNQPVSIAIEADQRVFQMYDGGILDDPACGQQLDHGVLVVGYCKGDECDDVDTLTKGDGFWVVKNSWSAGWGEQGYIRIAMGADGPEGLCGIAASPSFPVV